MPRAALVAAARLRHRFRSRRYRWLCRGLRAARRTRPKSGRSATCRRRRKGHAIDNECRERSTRARQERVSEGKRNNARSCQLPKSGYGGNEGWASTSGLGLLREWCAGLKRKLRGSWARVQATGVRAAASHLSPPFFVPPDPMSNQYLLPAKGESWSKALSAQARRRRRSHEQRGSTTSHGGRLQPLRSARN